MGPEHSEDVDGTSNRGELVEHEPLLPISTSSHPQQIVTTNSPTKARFSVPHLVGAFLLGIIVQFIVANYDSSSPGILFPPSSSDSSTNYDADFVPPYVGSTEVHEYPPSRPTNVDPTLFPSNIGFGGPTPTGAEPALLATAPVYPIHSGAPGILSPPSLAFGKSKSGKVFDLFRHWGNLSPWFSNEVGAFGVESGPKPPEGCRITGLHLLHRHGARYPTGSDSYGEPNKVANRLHNYQEKWSAGGTLAFLNDWTYKLGEEVLTPFGRRQLFDLGVSMRMKYGFLLKNFTESDTLPVFRTESQDRMLASAMNFAIGFFGYPLDNKYQQSITVEHTGYNNTLAPSKTCSNADDPTKGGRSTWYVRNWAEKYLKDAQGRLNADLDGFELSIEDVYGMQTMCAYETVALGYSKFCELFTEEEWESFDYSLDLYFWYKSGFGSPVARAQGIGYIQELVARLTQTPIATHNSSTNSTLDDNPITFPLDGRSLYVDATHEVVVLNVLTALNLSTLTNSGPLPVDFIPKDRSFSVSRLAPFATNLQFQLLSCSSEPSTQIRVIANDGVIPLSPIKGCSADIKSGMCSVDTFVGGMKDVIAETDWSWDCHGDWNVPEGDEWTTVIGSPPSRDAVI